VDTRGLAAAACYEAPLEGLAISPLGLVAPLFAAPVMRGQTRVRPGEPRPAASPIALRARRGLVDLVLGVAQTPEADLALEAVLGALGAPTVAEAVAAAPSGRAVAVVRTRESALVVASA
jgi:hypothetical protein